MPAHLLGAALGAEDWFTAHSPAHDWLADHSPPHEVAATSFITVRLPTPRLRVLPRIINAIISPEIKAYHWLEGKLDGIWHQLFDSAAVPAEQARMVDYYAASCPHCKDLTPVWKAAAEQWAGQPEAKQLVWQEKQCLDENWKPGKDFEECQAAQIQGFPTVRFYRPGSRTGDEFFFERTPESLLKFAKTGVSPSETTLPRGEGDTSDVKVVDFYSEACPHCKALDPVWAKAESQWDTFAKAETELGHRPGHEDVPVVSFVKKECYDNHWNPGKDYAECEKLNIQAFPSIKVFGPSLSGHGFDPAADYVGSRTPEGITDFLKKQAGLESGESSHQGQVHDILRGHDVEAARPVHPADIHENNPGPTVPEEEFREEPSPFVPASAPTHAKPAAGAAVVAASEAVESAKAAVVGTKGLAPQAPPVELPQALAQAVKTALAPLPVIACLPEPRARLVYKVPTRSPRVEAPPSAPAEFL